MPGGGKLDALLDCVSSGKGGGPEAYRQVYLGGARNLRAAFRPARFVYTGSTSVYAQTDGSAVDEESPAEPDRETGRILRETEAVVLGHARGELWRGWPGFTGRGGRTCSGKFLAGEATIEGDGGRWLNQIHRDDAAAALFRLAQPDAPPGIYNVADDSPLTQLELYRGLATEFSRELPHSRSRGSEPQARLDQQARAERPPARAGLAAALGIVSRLGARRRQVYGITLKMA